jgi:lipopolysaccharide/colanic/teichoic acid biosynthesis glycosyltransferase
LRCAAADRSIGSPSAGGQMLEQVRMSQSTEGIRTPLEIFRVDAPATRHFRIKRAIDAVMASLLLIFFGPLLLLAAAIVTLDGGPVFFLHRRIGKGGVPFFCIKFRTMVPNAQTALDSLLEADPVARQEWDSNFKLKRDPRVTRVGRFLRQSSLDELPQLINVLRGEMALVGPRPIVAAEVGRYGPDIAYYYRCRPGITGPWQISGRSDGSYRYRVQLDVEYAKRASLMSDFIILAKTAKVVIRGVGAY